MAEKKADSKKKDGEKTTDPAASNESESKADGNPKPGEGAKSATSNAAPTVPPTDDGGTTAGSGADARRGSSEDAPTPRAHSQTIAMPADATVGAPPPLPAQPAGAEDVTSLPGPNDIPTGDPTAPAAPPGKVPRGDSRSLRKGTEFALIYRQKTHVIVRTGTVGQRGTWRVVEYPTVVMASTSYARECSKFVGDGFSDYR